MTSFGNNDIFLLKLTSAGNFVWAKQMGGAGAESGRGLVTDHSGNIYSTGWFADTADFDPGTGSCIFGTNPRMDDIFVSKLDSSGNFVWAKQMGSYNGLDHGFAIAIDAQRNVYTTGSFFFSGDFDPGSGTYMLTSASNFEDIFFSKLDSMGNFIWAKRVGGAVGPDNAYGIKVDSFDNIYSTGSFNGTVDFDPGAGTFNLTTVLTTRYDAFMLKLDSAGLFQWAGSWGSKSDDIGYGIDVARNGSCIYVSGHFSDTTDFDPSSATCYINAWGAFVEKFAQCEPVTPTVTITAHPGLTISAGQTDTFSSTVSGGTVFSYQWLLNGAPIAGATLSSFVISTLTEGDVICCLVNVFDSCTMKPTMVTSCVTVHIGNAVGSLQTAVGSLSVYPNPNGGEFVIELSGQTGDREGVVRVVDLLGREVYRGVLPGNGKGSVQLGSEIAGGVYLVQIVIQAFCGKAMAGEGGGGVVTTRVSVVR